MNDDLGTVLRCGLCGHERKITAEWLEKVAFGHRLVAMLPRLQCDQCKGRNVIVVPLDAQDVRPVIDSGLCRKCRGDGGIGGNCPTCGGSGFAHHAR